MLTRMPFRSAIVKSSPLRDIFDNRSGNYGDELNGNQHGLKRGHSRIHGDAYKYGISLGTKFLPKLRSVQIENRIEFSVTLNTKLEKSFESELRKLL
jgi:hypothetical protein